MARKFEIQLKQWIPLIIESYYTYETLNTFEIVKHSGKPLVILGPKNQIQEILAVIGFLIEAKFLSPKDKTIVHYFGVDFESCTYEISDAFKEFIKKGLEEGKESNNDDWIEKIKVENTTHNTVNIYNFNFTFALEKLIEIKAGLLNL